jgi:hypothetical protein
MAKGTRMAWFFLAAVLGISLYVLSYEGWARWGDLERAPDTPFGAIFIVPKGKEYISRVFRPLIWLDRRLDRRLVITFEEGQYMGLLGL